MMIQIKSKLFFLFALLYISSGLLVSICSAQQEKEPVPVPEKQQLQVNWFYGPYVPKDVPLRPMTLKNRLKLYERQTFTTPGIYVRSGFLGLVNQGKGNPEEWGGGMEGYGKRVASSYGQALIQNSLSATGNELLQYEPRYDRCRCSGLWPRTRHAFMRNFLTYNKTENELRPQFALYGAAFSSGMIASTWKPGSGAWERGSYGILAQAGFGVLSNWVGEFAPEIRRALSRKHPDNLKK
jgi:hypothetical protein